ncbi:type 1 fimbrial protein [Burkholderia cenocepacia]|nr:type 1 fimbrial protein [Burkholderia cenocepacia]
MTHHMRISRSHHGKCICAITMQSDQITRYATAPGKADSPMKRLLQLIITVLCTLIPVSGHADCGTYNETFSFGTVRVPPNLKNGEPVASTIVEFQFICQNVTVDITPYFNTLLWESPYSGIAIVAGSTPGGSSVIWPSLGLRVSNLDTGEIMTSGFKGQPSKQFGPSVHIETPFGKTVKKFRVKVELIKIHDNVYRFTSPVNQPPMGGTVGFTLTFRFDNTPSFIAPTLVWGPSGPITVVPQSCTVTTPSVSVPLPPVAASKLNAVGATAGEANFAIGLSCASGSNVYVTLTDLTNPGNTSNQLSLAPESSAKGVKLRILRNGQPVSYGPDSSMTGNPNQWLVGPSASTSRIPLSAEYIATDRVSAGTVKGVATFTMSYQ